MANDAMRRQRFELEARAVAALNHPNIVAVYDVGDGYIVSEMVEGERLRGRFSPRKVIDIGVQVASGLAAAHEAGIVHRDLKPDNILLTRDGRPKILGFGLAKVTAAPSAADETLTVKTEAGVVMGTPGCMSPEQVQGSRPIIAAMDTMQAILREEAPELPEGVPAGVRQIVAHCLEKDGGRDSVTGRIPRVLADPLSDRQSAVWTPDGHILATKLGVRGAIWKFQAEAK